MYILPTLNFGENGKEAIQTYEKAFGGKITSFITYRDANDPEFMYNPLVMRFMGGIDANRPEGMKKMTEKYYQMAQWAEEHPEYKDKTWNFNFDDTLHRDGTYYYFTQCPIEKFARENGYLEILPVICDTDYFNSKCKEGGTP